MTRTQILVVEDELLVAEDVSRKLTRLDYEVAAVTTTGEEAVRLAAELHPDLVLMDIGLPGKLNGVQVADQIRSRLDIPVVYLTAHSDKDTLHRAKRTGPFGYVLKPFDTRDLHSTLEMALYKHAQEKKLRESEARYRSLFDSVPVGLYRTAPDGRILDANPALVEMLGYPDRATLLARNVRHGYTSAADRAGWQAEMEDEGIIHDFEMQVQRYDGTIIWVRDSARAVRDAEGQVLYYDGVMEDITERRRAEAALRDALTEAERGRQMLLTVAQAAQAVQRARAPQEVYRTIADEMVRLGYHPAVFGLNDDRTQLILLHHGFESSVARRVEILTHLSAQGCQFPLAPGGYFQRIIAGGQPVFDECAARSLVDMLPQALRPLASRLTTMLGVGQAICAPLRVSGETVGLLAVIGENLSEADLPAITALANQASIALENAHLFEQVRAARERLESLSRRLLEAQETERRRIARELHDEIGQALTVIKINLQAALRSSDLPSLAPYLADALRTVEGALPQVRGLSLDLRPSLLDDLGLVPALRWCMDRQAQQAGFSARFVSDPQQDRLPPQIEIACFRIVQEALTNTMRHAKASQVLVELRRDGEGLRLCIRDDGQGFDVSAALAAAARGESLGLFGMEERVQLLGGRLEIDSAPGQGTEIRVCLPKAHLAPTGRHQEE